MAEVYLTEIHSNIKKSDPPEVSNAKLCYAIGSLMIHWANNESLFFAIFYIISKAPRNTARVLWFTRKSTRDRLDFTLRIAQIHLKNKKTLLQKIEGLATMFIKLSSLRNHYAHAYYTEGEDGRLESALCVNTPYGENSEPLKEKDLKIDHIRHNEIKQECEKLKDINLFLWTVIVELQEDMKIPLVKPPSWISEK